MNISIIVAASENNAIGKNNTLPWHLPVDMKFFKDKTTGHCIITGRKNYESIPDKFRPLPNRTNIVITRQKDYKAPGAVVVSSVYEALEAARETGDSEVFVIGGAEIFRETMDMCDTVYLTRVHTKIEGDVYFQPLNIKEWKRVEGSPYKADEKNSFDLTFEKYVRVR
jgi:dihydrofolate reductase